MEDGAKIIKIFKEYMSKTCILDDFKFYETRQKMIRDKKIKQKKQVTHFFKPLLQHVVVDSDLFSLYRFLMELL